ncbi:MULTISPECIES: DUF6207 family protein [unclassified Streptomyces]|uniref:DUF6207 family protein n=1 Tax=unclassified Streptomyces TaxID=2593676 RepID=UPI002DD95B89|nr:MULTISPECIES: DUF6207 family protein [unclassified Streptomyces]WSS46826.1 DUF6207 family protein [Streptomyces sp. NBC_01187]WSA97657.1 DUF6207 family protein [Streptomyces sp. NBC_01795]WSB82093.1 DUF6207 family protein [Streptomyces sp. NBC_01775]WSS18064.1 DUF6207 family protein [Streptomyces sp. NBC_01186]WSS46957.1 DUF6207 family protein [Streptomyces sp. NBC_01187]
MTESGLAVVEVAAVDESTAFAVREALAGPEGRLPSRTMQPESRGSPGCAAAH